MSPSGPDQNNPSYNNALGAEEPTHAKGLSEENGRWLQAAMQNSSDIVMIFEADATIRYASPAVERVLGYRPEDLVGTVALDYVHPEDLEYMSKSFSEALKKPGFQPLIEYRVRAADGSWRYMEAIRSNRLDDPEVAGLVANVRDVTEHKEAEERSHLLVQNASDVSLIMEADQTVRYISPAVERVLGYRPEEVVGNDNFVVVHPDDMERVGELSAEAVRNPGTTLSMELHLRHKDGSWRHVESSFTSLLDDPAVGGIVINSRDITERKRAETALRESEDRLRTILDNSAVSVYLKDVQGRYTLINSRAEALLGLDREQVIGKTDYDLLPREIADKLRANDRKVLESGTPLEYEEELVLGGERCTSISVKFPLYNTEGHPYAVCGISTDITERKEAEEALKESEERFRATFEDAPVGVALVNLDGRRFRANRSLCEMLGCSEEDLLGENYLEHVHPDDRQISTEHFQRTLEEEAGSYELERRYLHTDGHVVWNLTSVSLIRDSKGTRATSSASIRT